MRKKLEMAGIIAIAVLLSQLIVASAPVARAGDLILGWHVTAKIKGLPRNTVMIRGDSEVPQNTIYADFIAFALMVGYVDSDGYARAWLGIGYFQNASGVYVYAEFFDYYNNAIYLEASRPTVVGKDYTFHIYKASATYFQVWSVPLDMMAYATFTVEPNTWWFNGESMHEANGFSSHWWNLQFSTDLNTFYYWGDLGTEVKYRNDSPYVIYPNGPHELCTDAQRGGGGPNHPKGMIGLAS